MYSFDAFFFNLRTTPDDAYRYAKDDPIDHPWSETPGFSDPAVDFLMATGVRQVVSRLAGQQTVAEHGLNWLPRPDAAVSDTSASLVFD